MSTNPPEANKVEELLEQVENELKAARRQYAEILAGGEQRFLSRETYIDMKAYWQGTVDALAWSLEIVNKKRW